MNKKDLPHFTVLHPYFLGYIAEAEDGDLMDVLDLNLQKLQNLPLKKLEALRDYVYEPGKWTLKQIFQHLIDVERMFCARITRFARQDGVVPQSFDEELFAQNANVAHRTLADLLEELILVRRATIALFKSFDEKTWLNTGQTSAGKVSVLGMGYTLIGHQNHHLSIIDKRYLREA